MNKNYKKESFSMKRLLLNNKYQLAWNEYGSPDGEPLFYFHGTPGSRVEPQAANDIARDLGIRLIAPDRPGYGDSDVQDDFRLLDWPDCISQLADNLQLKQFSILSFSGGGAYALACAHELADRLKRITIAGSPAPFETEVMQEHICAESKPLYELSAADYPAAIQQVSQLVNSLDTFLEILQAPLPPSDTVLFEQDSFHQHYLENLTLATTHGVNGIVNDLRNLTLPWQFNLEDIQLPIDIWHGSEDRSFGLAIAKYLSNTLKNTSTHFLDNSGHLLLFTQWKEILGYAIR